ncbi:MAG: glycoside hydrolase family 31 protein [Chitinophagales bacterium]|nr:glycoside hydrolase family 31 protein [Chitinophagales bacterium]
MPTAGQILQVTPSFPTTDDSVTIIFNAQLGDGGLAGYTGNVYAHTGVITDASQHPSDWKHVVAPWGSTDPKVLMESLGGDLYRIRFHIRSYYGIAPEEKVCSLAFVFRNASGNLSGREADGSDIFYPVNRLPLGNLLSYTFNSGELIVTAQNGTMRVRLHDTHVACVQLQADSGAFPDTSLSVIQPQQSVSCVLTAGTDYLKLSGSALAVIVYKNPVRLAFVLNGDTILQEAAGMFSSYGSSGVQFRLRQPEWLYGTGSRALDLNRRGRKLSSYNTAVYGYEKGATTLNISIPFLLSSRGYGVFMDNFSPGTWDLGYSDSLTWSYTAESGLFRYYVVAGPGFPEIVERYTALTGRQPLPPRWALGYFQSRYGYQNETEARSVVQQLRNAQFPLDALVLDLYWFGQPFNMGNLAWDVTRFPTAADMISDFDSMGIKTILITEPYITKVSTNYPTVSSQGWLATNAQGQPYLMGNFWAGEAGLLDVFKPAAQDWFWNQYEARIAEGVGGWWCDLGEPELHPADMVHVIGPARSVHNVYSLSWAEMLFKRYQQHVPQQRLFNLIRSGYAGMQRYSTFPWSGDVRRSWSGLQAQIPILLSMGLCGVGYMHSDIGGFTGGPLNEELYIRWQQLGAFHPVMRAHGEGVPTEPTAYSISAQNTVRKYINLRYELTPYNYTLAYENSLKGLPLMRPLNFYDPADPTLANVNDAFYWGADLLVAPVVQQGASSRTVTFPPGTWLLWDQPKQSYTGGSTATVSAPLSTLPLFVRAGSFIPMVPPKLSLQQYDTDTLTVRYFPDACCPQTTAMLYDDDGQMTTALADSAFERIFFNGFVGDAALEVHLSQQGDYPGSPQQRLMEFVVYRLHPAPDMVWVGALSIPGFSSWMAYQQADTGWYYDAAAQVVYTRLRWGGDSVVIRWEGTSVVGMPVTMSRQNSIHAFPNPFTREVVLQADVAALAVLRVFNLQGTCIRTLPPADGRWLWDGTDEFGRRLPAGVYVAVIQSGGRSYRNLLVLQ